MDRSWTYVKEHPVHSSVAAALIAMLIGSVGGMVEAQLRTIPERVQSVWSDEDKPSVVDQIGELPMWSGRPTLYPDSFQALSVDVDHAASLIRDETTQVRTADELRAEAPALSSRPVVVVGRVRSVGATGARSRHLSTVIELSGSKRDQTAVWIGGRVELGLLRPPPPMIPVSDDRLIPLPGSTQRMKPRWRYGVVLGRVAAVGTVVGSGPTRGVYFLATRALLTTLSPRAMGDQIGPAIAGALSAL